MAVGPLPQLLGRPVISSKGSALIGVGCPLVNAGQLFVLLGRDVVGVPSTTQRLLCSVTRQFDRPSRRTLADR
jgi:hypothetical protein